MNVALVHDYLVDAGGAERVLLILHDMFPSAPIYTSVFDARTAPSEFSRLDVRTSFLQRVAAQKKNYKLLLPLFPLAFESLDLSGYDLVISSTTSFAKGVVTDADATHFCYCNTPSRFAWRAHDYLRRERYPAPIRAAIWAIIHYLRLWDYAAAQRVDYFMAGSANAARRIRKHYGRSARVIASPIDVRRFTPAADVDDYYLIVSRLMPYKRIDLAVEAFNRLRLPLWIAGDGPARAALERLAGPTIRFLGRVSDEEVPRLFARCRALVQAGEEDWGLTPIEANASGRPVVAFAGGGALETVIPGVTGVLFDEPTWDALADAVRNLQPATFQIDNLRAHAESFDVSKFKEQVFSYISEHTPVAASGRAARPPVAR